MNSLGGVAVGIFLFVLAVYWIGVHITLEYLLFYEKGTHRTEEGQKFIAIAWIVTVPIIIALKLWRRW